MRSLVLPLIALTVALSGCSKDSAPQPGAQPAAQKAAAGNTTAKAAAPSPSPSGCVSGTEAECWAGCEADDLTACARINDALNRSDADEASQAPSWARLAKALERHCARDERRACRGVGELYAEGRGVTQSLERAVKALRRGCVGDGVKACQSMVRGVMAEERFTYGAALLSALCAESDTRACAALARSYSQGRGVPVDPARAGALQREACQAGDARSCFERAVALLADSDNPKARKLALEAMAVGCKGANAPMCAGRGQDAHEAGDDTAAAVWLQGACEGGEAESCSNLGFLYERGAGVDQDRDRAMAFYKKACDGGSKTGCGNVDIMSGGGASVTAADAVAAKQTACDSGSARACRDLAASYAVGAGVEKDLEKARAFLTKGCKGGEADRCEAIGRAAEDREQEAFAAAAYQIGCDAGSTLACVGLGERYFVGVGISRDPERAYEIFTAACKKGNAVACRNAAIQQSEGEGVPQDETAALPRFRKGCDLGDPPACLLLGQRIRAGRGTDADEAAGTALMQRSCDMGFQKACEELSPPVDDTFKAE